MLMSIFKYSYLNHKFYKHRHTFFFLILYSVWKKHWYKQVQDIIVTHKQCNCLVHFKVEYFELV